MRKLSLSACLLAVAAFVLSACTAVQPAPASAAPDLTNLPDGCLLGDRVDVDGAVIYAVVSKNTPDSTDYLTLHEAMEAKKATVREMGEGGSVNTLIVCNDARQPLFLMAGDLLLGGQQDRIVAESVVVDGGAKDVPVPVFCVEHGRWQLQGKDAGKCSGGCFYTETKCGQCDLSVKKAAIESRAQGEVWDKVAENNSNLGIAGQTGSGTFRATFDSKENQEKIEKNYTCAQKLVGSDVVGYAVYVDGQMVAMDVFDSAGLANKLSEKLLRSYIITGINGGYKEEVVKADRAGGGNSLRQNSNANNDFGTRTFTGEENQPTENATAQPAADPKPVETTVNDRTHNLREYKKEAVNYTCNDMKTGRAVQRSLMRR